MAQSDRIPVRIDPCPLIEVIVDLRFVSAVPSEAVFGVIYNRFRKRFGEGVEKLPVLQLPEQIRAHDPNLRYQPCYRLRDGDFVMQIGPQLISFVNLNQYVGWDAFYGRIRESIAWIGALNVVDSFLRMGLRYINFFDFDIFEHINLSVMMQDGPLVAKQLAVRSTLETGGYLTNLNIVNNSTVSRGGGRRAGSVLDIDTYLEQDGLDMFTSPDTLIGDAHTEEKTLFFGLLKPDFLAQLNPIHEGVA